MLYIPRTWATHQHRIKESINIYKLLLQYFLYFFFFFFPAPYLFIVHYYHAENVVVIIVVQHCNQLIKSGYPVTKSKKKWIVK